MCWLYFDKEKLVPLIQHWLTRNGFLLIATLIWLPREDPVAQGMEKLVLKYNPQWQGADFSGDTDQMPGGLPGDFKLKVFHKQRVQIPFSRESWRGKIRACRGVGASLPQKQIEKFDCEHADWLQKTVAPEFYIQHMFKLSIFELAD